MKKSKVSALLLVVILCIGGCGKRAEISKNQQALKQEGMELQLSGDYEGAIQKYQAALELAGTKAGEEEMDIACYKASAQYRAGDVEGAIDTYSALLDLKKREDIYLGRGLLYVAANDAERAEADLNKVLKETDDPLIQGIIYDVVGETAKAKKYFERAKKAGNPEALLYLAKVYEKTGDTDYALILLEEYTEGKKASAEGYLTAGRQYFQAGAYENALEAVQEGIALGETGVLKNLLLEEVACYEKLGDFSGAREKAKEYLELYPEDTAMEKEYEFLKSR